MTETTPSPTMTICIKCKEVKATGILSTIRKKEVGAYCEPCARARIKESKGMYIWKADNDR